MNTKQMDLDQNALIVEAHKQIKKYSRRVAKLEDIVSDGDIFFNTPIAIKLKQARREVTTWEIALYS